MVRLSLITPSLNQLSFLKECVTRVQQFDERVEHIVSDGNSCDGTREYLEHQEGARKQQTGCSFRYRSSHDQSMYEAVNLGLEMAHGDILGYINCDDIIMPWTPDYVIRFFDEHPQIDWIYGDAFEANGSRWAFLIHPPADLLSTYVWGGGFLAQPSVFFRKSVFQQVGGFELEFKLLADHQYWIRLMQQNFRCAKVWDILSTQRVVDGQLMQKHATLAEKERHQIMSAAGASPTQIKHRRAGNYVFATLHRFAILTFLSHSIQPPFFRTKYWSNAINSNFWELSSADQTLKSFFRSTEHLSYLTLSESGLRQFPAR